MAIAGEVSPVRVRAKSMAIGFTFNYFSTAWNVPIPYLYNTTEANLGGKIGRVFAGMGVIALGIIFFRDPRDKGPAIRGAARDVQWMGWYAGVPESSMLHG
jgi:hypothetical protein